MRTITNLFFTTSINAYNQDTITINMGGIGPLKPYMLYKIASDDHSNLFHLSCNIPRDRDYNIFKFNNIMGSLNEHDIDYNHCKEIMNHDQLIPPPGIDVYSIYTFMEDAAWRETAITIFVN